MNNSYNFGVKPEMKTKGVDAEIVLSLAQFMFMSEILITQRSRKQSLKHEMSRQRERQSPFFHGELVSSDKTFPQKEKGR